MQWIRVDANLDDHPKSVEAGFWGTVVIQVIWRLAKRHGERGHLGARYVTERHLRHVTRCPEELSHHLSEGLLEARRVGFLVINDDGSVDVHGWDEVQWDATHAERQRKYRERKMLERDGGDESRDGVTRVTVTPPHPDPTPTPTPQEEGKEGAPPASPPVPVACRPSMKQTEKEPGAAYLDTKSPPNGLDNPDRVRRAFYLLWEKKYEVPYAQEPAKDRAWALALLKQHKAMGIQVPWLEWAPKIIAGYLDLDDDDLVKKDRHTMNHLTRKLNAIRANIGGAS